MNPLRHAAKHALDGGVVAIIADAAELNRLGHAVADQAGNARTRFLNAAREVRFLESGGRVLLISSGDVNRLRGEALAFAVLSSHEMLWDREIVEALVPCFLAVGRRGRIAVLG